MNTLTSVAPAGKSLLSTSPFTAAGYVWDSFVKNTVYASAPASPPSTLNIVIVSDWESFDTEMVNGKWDFDVTFPFAVDAPLSNVKSNEPSVKVGTPIVPPPFLVIVISLFVTAALKFCAFTDTLIVDGVAEVSVESSNVNVWEVALKANNLALSPGVPSVPALDFAIVWVLVKLKLVPSVVLPLIGYEIVTESVLLSIDEWLPTTA